MHNGRDLLESSFEELITLNDITPELAIKIISKAADVPDTQKNDNFDLNCTLIWLFSNGVPREIKRSLLIINRDKTNLVSCTATEVWQILMRYTITSIKQWCLVNGGDETQSYLLLSCLDEIEKNPPLKDQAIHDWETWFKPGLRKLTDLLGGKTLNSPAKGFSGDNIVECKALPAGTGWTLTFVDSASQSTTVLEPDPIFERAVLELMVLMSTFLLIFHSRDRTKLSIRLQTIFSLSENNKIYAYQELKKTLSEYHLYP